MTSDLSFISQAVSRLELEARTLRSQLTHLSEQGVAHASLIFEKDRGGDKTVMRLCHRPDSPTAPATRQRREYIGHCPLKQSLARQRMARWPEYTHLQSCLRQVENRLVEMHQTLNHLTRLATGCSTCDSPNQLLTHAQQLYRQGRLNEVLQVVELLEQETTPETSPALLGQAALLQSRVYTAWGHYSKSLTSLTTALTNLSGQPAARLSLHLCWGYTLWLDRQLGAACKQVQNALSLLPLLSAQPAWSPAGLSEIVLETYPVLVHTQHLYPTLPDLNWLLRLCPTPSRPTLQFYCLGMPTLWVKHKRHLFNERRPSCRVPALLAYLFYQSQGCTWSQLALALWPDSPAKTISNRLHQTLKSLRQNLLEDPRYIQYQAGTYRFNSAYYTWSDGSVFDELLQRLSYPPTAETLPRYLDVLRLYQGKFLAGFPLSEWGLQQRQHYEDRFLQLSHVTARHLLEQERVWEALWVIERGLEQNYYREGLHRLALHAYAQIGLYSELRQHYKQLCQQLGHPPEPQTEQLYQRLRRLYT